MCPESAVYVKASVRGTPAVDVELHINRNVQSINNQTIQINLAYGFVEHMVVCSGHLDAANGMNYAKVISLTSFRWSNNAHHSAFDSSPDNFNNICFNDVLVGHLDKAQLHKGSCASQLSARHPSPSLGAPMGKASQEWQAVVAEPGNHAKLRSCL